MAELDGQPLCCVIRFRPGPSQLQAQVRKSIELFILSDN